MTRDFKLVALSLFFWGLGDSLYFFFQPLYMAQLGAGAVQIGSILGIAGVAQAATHIPAGYIADRLGRRGLLMGGWILGAAATTAMFLSHSLLPFAVGLVFYNFTAFVLAPLNSYITESRGTQTVERALTAISAYFSLGAIIAPILGGLIAERLGLRAIYGFSAALFWLSTFIVLFIGPQPVHSTGAGRRYTLLLQNKRFLNFMALVFFVVFAMYIGLPLSSNFLQQVRGVSLSQIGVLGSLTNGALILVNWFSGKSHPRRGYMVAQALVGAHMLLLWRGTGMIWYGLAYLGRAGFANSHSLANAQVGRVVAPKELGMAYGISETATSLALILAPVLAGYLYDHNAVLPFQVSLGLIAVSIFLTWLFAPRRDAHSPPEVPVIEPLELPHGGIG